MIPQLTEAQADSLFMACNSKVQAFVVLQPRPSDPVGTTEKLNKLGQDATALVELGMAVDVSDSFQQARRITQEKHGMDCKVYSPTRAAFLMFHGAQNRTIQ